MLRSLAVILLSGLGAAVLYAAADPPLAPKDAELAEMRRQFESAAGQYAHFATGDVLSNRPTDREWPRDLIAEQSKLLADLQKWARQPQALRALIGHRDPKVRTLVLGALFVREDPHDLPLIASLVDDKAPTFPDAHASPNAAGFTGNLKEILDAQTVGRVAQAMLGAYLQAAPLRDDCKFAEYWRAREARQTCASWFLVRISRATRNTSPPQPQYERDLQRVISEFKDLPPAERAWTQVFLRCMSFTKLDATLTDAACLAALKEIGPDQIVRFLERQRVTDDPDLWFDNIEHKNSRVHSLMAHFILHRARDLLRVQDVPALLEREEFERKTPKTGIGVSPAWAGAAAELIGESDPAVASRIIEDALGRFPLTDILGGRHQAMLIGSLWRVRGAKEKQKIVDWFYQAEARVTETKSNESNHGPADFLGSVRTAGRPDTKDLMGALVADPRLDQTDWPATHALLDIASDGLPEALVSQRELYSVWPQRDARTAKALVKWREILKRHYRHD